MTIIWPASPQFHAAICLIHLGKYGDGRAAGSARRNDVRGGFHVDAVSWNTAGRGSPSLLPTTASTARGQTLCMPEIMPHFDDT